MKLPPEAILGAQALVYQEALHLDAQRWDEWLALYTEDARFWMPAWTDEHTLGASPETELSLMYIPARAGLEDRVWRVRSGLSVANTPLPRTCHQVTNPVVTAAGEGSVKVASSWSCQVLRLKDRDRHTFCGRYEHVLHEVDGQWRIAGKTIVLLDDVIPTLLDFYCV